MFFYFIIYRMINKKELIIKINNILNKFKKKQLINFYDSYINKKGGSLRPLCNHINNKDFDKEVNEMYTNIKDLKLLYPTKYHVNKTQYNNLSKEIYLISKILYKLLFLKYDEYIKKNIELKYSYICYTRVISPLNESISRNIDTIKDFFEIYLKKIINRETNSIKIIDKSNKISIKIGQVEFFILYTKEFNRITILMPLQEITEKKIKQYFDEFPECYKSTEIPQTQQMQQLRQFQPQTQQIQQRQQFQLQTQQIQQRQQFQLQTQQRQQFPQFQPQLISQHRIFSPLKKVEDKEIEKKKREIETITMIINDLMLKNKDITNFFNIMPLFQKYFNNIYELYQIKDKIIKFNTYYAYNNQYIKYIIDYSNYLIDNPNTITEHNISIQIYIYISLYNMFYKNNNILSLSEINEEIKYNINILYTKLLMINNYTKTLNILSINDIFLILLIIYEYNNNYYPSIEYESFYFLYEIIIYNQHLNPIYSKIKSDFDFVYMTENIQKQSAIQKSMYTTILPILQQPIGTYFTTPGYVEEQRYYNNLKLQCDKFIRQILHDVKSLIKELNKLSIIKNIKLFNKNESLSKFFNKISSDINTNIIMQYKFDNIKNNFSNLTSKISELLITLLTNEFNIKARATDMYFTKELLDLMLEYINYKMYPNISVE